MAGNLFYLPKQIPLDNGIVLPGAKLTFTQTGTTTPQNTYTDIELTTPSSNPVIADSEGVFAPIYLDPSLPNYRIKLDDSSDVLIYQVDDIPAGQGGDSLTLEGTSPFFDLIETGVTTDNSTWRVIVDAERLLVRLYNDALTLFNNIIAFDRTGITADTLNVLTTDFQHNSSPVASTSGGAFTATLTGMTTATTGTVNYSITGNICTLYTSGTQVSGTSNTTAMTMTGLPAAVIPVNRVEVPTLPLNAGGAVSGSGEIGAASSTVTFYMGSTLSSVGFTNSGTKGIGNDWQMTYLIT